MPTIGTTPPTPTLKARTRKGAALTVVAALAAALLVVVAPPPATAVVGQVRTTGDDRPLQPTANPRASRAKAGPNFAVNPTNASHIVELHQELETEECEYNVSRDGGATWTGGELQAPAGYPADLPGPCDVTGHGAGNIGQQSVAFGSGNNVYIAWTSSRVRGASQFTVLLSRSTDGGATFATATEVPGMIGGATPLPDWFRPEIAVDRRAAGDRLYIVSRDSRSNKAFLVRSNDGGTTWEPAVEVSQTEAPQPVFDASGNVTTAGNAYRRTTEVTGPVLGPQGTGGERAIYVAWTARRDPAPSVPAGQQAPPCPPTTAGPSYCEGPNETAANGYVVVARSTDGGRTWTRTRAVNVQGWRSPTGSVFAGSNYPRIAAGPEGNVYVTFTQGPGVGRSNNCGVGPFPAGAPGAGQTNPCPVFTAEGYTAAGNFQKADHFIHWDADQWFIRSTDGGATWRDLRKLNDPKQPGLTVPEVTQTRHAQPYVAPDGRVDIVWEDRRHWYIDPSFRRAATTPGGTGEFRIPAGQTNAGQADPANLSNYPCVHTHAACDEARLGDTYYTWSTDGGVTFGPNRRVNDRSHNNDVGSDYRFSVYWDYGPAAVPLGNDELLVADMDARLGNFDTDSLDMFLRRVNLNAGTGPVPVKSLASGNPPGFSVAVSRHAYPGGSEGVLAGTFANGPMTKVVIVNDNDVAAALVGGVLARANLGPVLASPAGGLPEDVRAEVSRMRPIGAYVIGGTNVLSAQVEADLAAAGVPALEIRRIQGASAAEMAANVATELDRRSPAERAANPTVPSFDAAVVVNPTSASAAAVSALAANRRLPVLFADADGIPAATRGALDTLRIPRTLVVGSTAVISDNALRQLPSATRVGSGDQFTTSRAVVAESLNWGLPRNIVYVADGNEPMHGALLGAAVGRIGGLLLLTPGGDTGAAETAVNNLVLRPHVDRFVASNLTGIPVVPRDPLGPGDQEGDGGGPLPPIGGGGNGYRMVAADGGIFTFNRSFHGSTGDIRLNQPIVGGATDPSDFDGYWIVARDGGVFTFNVPFFGSLGGESLPAPAVEIEPTPTGQGYFIVLANGTVRAFGDARHAGDMAGQRLNRPIIGMTVTPTGNGYWLVGEDGGIFTFGDAQFLGSTGNLRLNAPVIDLAPTPDGTGYYLVARDGGVFTFGTAVFHGSTGNLRLNAPVVAMLVAPGGGGYWLAATDGGIFTFGAAEFLGSMGGTRLNAPVLDLVH